MQLHHIRDAGAGVAPPHRRCTCRWRCSSSTSEMQMQMQLRYISDADADAAPSHPMEMQMQMQLHQIQLHHIQWRCRGSSSRWKIQYKIRGFLYVLFYTSNLKLKLKHKIYGFPYFSNSKIILILVRSTLLWLRELRVQGAFVCNSLIHRRTFADVSCFVKEKRRGGQRKRFTGGAACACKTPANTFNCEVPSSWLGKFYISSTTATSGAFYASVA